jgi:hypothetical protein
VKAGVEGPLYIAEDSLDEGEVRLPRIMHEEADLLYGEGEVGPSQRQVL